MTTDVRLLSTYKGFPPQSIISLPDAEATSLVAVSHASLTLTGGTRRYIPVANRDTAAQKLPLGLHVVTQNQEMQVLIPEGQTVTLTGDASAAATVTRNGTADSWAIGAGATRTIGPYLNQQVLTVQCAAGTVTAENHNAAPYFARLPTDVPNGGVNTSGMVNSVGAAIVTIRPVTNAYPGQAYDTSTFRQIYQVPFTGKCLVRAVYETTTATATTIDSTAFSAGRRYLDDDPVKADGTAGDWVLTTATAVSAASATANTDGIFGSGRTAWALVDIPAPTDGGLGGYIYVGTKIASGTRLGMVGNAGRSIANWEQYVSDKLISLKYRGLRKSGSDFVNSNQNGMGAATPSYLSEYAPVSHLEILPVRRAISGANFGDSTSDGLGTGTPLVQPNHYSWASIAANQLMLEAGKVLHVSNFGHEGKTTTYNITNRLGSFLADSDFCPSFVVIQPFSINDGTGGVVGALTTAIVNAGISSALLAAAACRKKGIIPIFRTVIPSVSLNSTTDAYRKAGNAAILASGELVIDLDSIVTDGATPARLRTEYSLDGTHLNSAGNEACAAPAKTTLRRVFFE